MCDANKDVGRGASSLFIFGMCLCNVHVFASVLRFRFGPVDRYRCVRVPDTIIVLSRAPVRNHRTHIPPPPCASCGWPWYGMGWYGKRGMERLYIISYILISFIACSLQSRCVNFEGTYMSAEQRVARATRLDIYISIENIVSCTWFL